MVASRLIIAGVAVAAAGGAGYIAKNMSAPPPARVVVQEPTRPAIETTQVLVGSCTTTRAGGGADMFLAM